MKSRLTIKKKKKQFFIFLDGKLFCKQEFLDAQDGISSALVTHLYLLKILVRFGLINNLKK